MAFGDIIQNPSPGSGSGTSITVNFASGPTEGNLLVACHMTGNANSIAPTGWSEGVTITNATESDECGIYYKIAGASEGTGVTCTSDASDEHVLIIIEIEGPWESSPVDLAEAEARQASGTTYTCNPAGTTSQADEVAVALIYTRNDANSTMSWSDSFVDRGVGTSSYKSAAAATKLLTATGSVTTTGTYGNSDVAQGGMVTFKKQAAVGAAPTSHILGPLFGNLGGPIG